MKFTAYVQTKGLYKALFGKEVIPEEIAMLAEDATHEQAEDDSETAIHSGDTSGRKKGPS